MQADGRSVAQVRDDIAGRLKRYIAEPVVTVTVTDVSGNRIYVEVEGVVYKTVFGGYWRSVFTGMEHYLLRCERVSSAAWADDNPTAVDLPIAYSAGGWTTSGHSLSFLLNRSSEYTEQ